MLYKIQMFLLKSIDFEKLYTQISDSQRYYVWVVNYTEWNEAIVSVFSHDAYLPPCTNTMQNQSRISELTTCLKWLHHTCVSEIIYLTIASNRVTKFQYFIITAIAMHMLIRSSTILLTVYAKRLWLLKWTSRKIYLIPNRLSCVIYSVL